MFVRGDKPNHRAVCALVHHVVLILVLLRALTPAGFMVDMASAARGTFELVICTAHGSVRVALDDPAGEPTDERGHVSDDAPCAFTGVVYVTPASQPSLSVRYEAVARQGPRPSGDHALPPIRAGPALGSRAPPAIS